MSPWIRFVVSPITTATVAAGLATAQTPGVSMEGWPPVHNQPAPLITKPEPAADECDPCKPFDWSKVPPVPRPTPRLGFFTLLPGDRPGYYTAYDFLTGTLRNDYPKSPFPPFILATLPFYDADWRFLDDPETPPQNLFDRMKRMRLGENWLLSSGGQTWFRYANEYNSRLTEQNNNYTLVRARPYLDVWYRDQFRFFIEGMFADSLWHDLPPLRTDIDRGDFQNFFVETRLGELQGQPVFARVGRQEMQFGSQRLISTLDWVNTRRTFDGARVFRVGENWDVDLFWVQPVIPNANRLNSHDNNQNFAGAWATYKLRRGTALDVYYLMLDNTNAVVQQGIQRAPATLHTIGSRYAGDVDGRYLWDVEGAIQLGRRGRQDVVAGMFTAGAGYRWKEAAWNPVLWMYYDYASGDNNPNEGTFTTFNQLFPFGHYYLGWADLVGRQNIHSLNWSLHLYPMPWITVWTQYHLFALDQPRDALYNIAGQAYRRDPTGRAGQFVGQELDLILNFHLSRRSDLLTGYSHFWGGEFLKNTRGPNAAVNNSLYYLSYSYRW
jgi:hypothetical protein